MTSAAVPFRVGQTLIGPLFNEPMWVETVSSAGSASWALGLVGAQSERFRRRLLTATPHKGDPANFSLFLHLLDADADADVKSIREATDRHLDLQAFPRKVQSPTTPQRW